ncbi:MAG: TauD/TfdA family dioxygenase, partial [Planctomycetota bacterium]
MPTDSPLGTVPQLVSDPIAALAVLRADGAVRLAAEHGDDASHAADVARRVFGAEIRALPEPAKVLDGGEMDRKQLKKGHAHPLPLHTDGFSYGDLYPDYILLRCVRSSPLGGESFLVDGYRVLDTLVDDPERGWVAEALQRTAVDQTEIGMQPSISPIVQRTPSGRLMVRRTLDEHGNGPVPSANSVNANRDAEMIQQWTEALTAAAERAPRFRLAPGETLVVDNYRMLHGREGYADPTRMLWRVWVWTQGALGVPDR